VIRSLFTPTGTVFTGSDEVIKKSPLPNRVKKMGIIFATKAKFYPIPMFTNVALIFPF